MSMTRQVPIATYRLAAARVHLLAFGSALLLVFVSLLTLPVGTRSLLFQLTAVASAALLAAIGIYFRDTRRLSIETADRVAVVCLLLLGANVAVAMVVEDSLTSAFWMAPLLVAGAGALRQPRWFVVSTALLSGVWCVGLGLRPGIGHQLEASVLMLCAGVVGWVLCRLTATTMAALCADLKATRIKADQLTERMEELRRQLRRKTSDSEELRSRLEDINRIAETDDVTGIANRRYLKIFLEENWALIARAYRAVSVVYLDVDDFCEFNAKYGYAAGDQVLVRIGDIVQRCAPNELQVAARVGGDKFMVVLPGVGSHGVAEIVADITSKIRRLRLPEFGVAAGEVRATAGVVSVKVRPTLHPFDLITAADQALGRAKLRHDNVVQFPGLPGTSVETFRETG